MAGSKVIHPEPCPECGVPGRTWCRGMCSCCYRRWHHAGFPVDGPPAPWQPSPPDEVAIERAMSGERLSLTPAERREAARRLRRRGLPRDAIAELLGCCVRTVERAIYGRTAA